MGRLSFVFSPTSPTVDTLRAKLGVTAAQLRILHFETQCRYQFLMTRGDPAQLCVLALAKLHSFQRVEHFNGVYIRSE